MILVMQSGLLGASSAKDPQDAYINYSEKKEGDQ